MEALEVEEGHRGVEHLDVVCFDQLLTHLEGVVLFAFGGLEVHGTHEKNRRADASCDEHFLEESDGHDMMIIVLLCTIVQLSTDRYILISGDYNFPIII